jgi:hypothetical protein
VLISTDAICEAGGASWEKKMPTRGKWHRFADNDFQAALLVDTR